MLLQGVMAKRVTPDGHTLKVLANGKIVRCSTCGELAKEFVDELKFPDPSNPERTLADKLSELEKRATADPEGVADEIKQLEKQLQDIRYPNEGKKDYQVFDPKNPERTITDIDRFEGNTLWEEKSATNAINRKTGEDLTSDWIQKNVTNKFEKILEARQHIPKYENAEIGFHFTKPGVDPAFRAGVEAEIARLQAANPKVTIRIKWE
jgi:hypothetical protein